MGGGQGSVRGWRRGGGEDGWVLKWLFLGAVERGGEGRYRSHI